MNSFSDIFELMKKQLDITDTARSLWIDPIKPVKLNNNKVTLFIANDYVKDMVQTHFDQLLKTNLKEVLGFDVEIEYLSEENNYENVLANDENVDIIRIVDPIPDPTYDPRFIDMKNKENNRE